MKNSFLDLLANLPTSNDLQPPLLPVAAGPLPPPPQQRGRAHFLDDLEYSHTHGIVMNMATPDGKGDDHYYASCRGGHFTADLKMCTEILGSESGDFMVDFILWTAMADDNGDDQSRLLSSSTSSTLLPRTATSMLRRKRLTLMHWMKDLPPLLSTLNGYGRPRFIHKKVTMSDGRVLISMDNDRRPRAITSSTSGDYGAVCKKLLVLSYNSDDSDDQERDEEEYDDDDDQMEMKIKKIGRTKQARGLIN